MLKLVLSQMGNGGASLEAVRRDGFVEITTREKLDRELESRIYRSSDQPGATAKSPDVDAVIDLIQTVEPNSWELQGGRGTIVHLGPIHVISQSPRVHDRIDDLLHSAREAISQTTAKK